MLNTISVVVGVNCCQWSVVRRL